MTAGQRPLLWQLLLPLALAATISAAAPSYALITSHLWQGAGTMGVTTDDSSSTATNFNLAANWVGGLPQGPDADASIIFSNAGAVYLKSPALVRRFKVMGNAPEPALHIQHDLTMNSFGIGSDVGSYGHVIQTAGTVRVELGTFGMSSGNAISVYDLKGGEIQTSSDTFVSIGDGGLATFNQSGGTQRFQREVTFGGLPVAEGIYNFSGGVIDGSAMHLGYIGKGTFNQSGGTAKLVRMTLGATTAGNVTAESTLRLSGGSLRLNELIAGGQNDKVALELVGPAAEFSIADRFLLGANALLTVAPGATVRLARCSFKIGASILLSRRHWRC